MESGSGRSVTRQNYRKYYHKSSLDVAKQIDIALLENVEILKQEMEADIINAFSWMLYDGIIDMRFAIPCEKLEEGDFHDKFGIFYKGNDALSFSGSINDSKHG